MSFVDYDDDITKNSGEAVQTGIADSKRNTQNVKVHVYTSRSFFFTSVKETIKYI